MLVGEACGCACVCVNDGGCEFVPRLPRSYSSWLVNYCPRHRYRQAQEKQTQGDKSGPSAPPSAICPTPATQNDGGCELVPRLSRFCSSWLVNYCPTTLVQTSAGEANTGGQIRTKRATQYHLSHACHAKRR